MKLFWSDVAEADLDNIYDHIARDVPYYAELFIDRLIEATNKLQDHPRIGRQVPCTANTRAGADGAENPYAAMMDSTLSSFLRCSACHKS